MAFDIIIFEKMFHLLKNEFSNSRINKINNISNLDYCFTLYKDKNIYDLILATNTNNSFISFTKDNNQYAFPNHFTYFLRKQIEGGIIIDIEQINNDRILKFIIKSFDDLGDPHLKFLFVELTGKQTNLILTKDDNIIIDCLNKQGPNENTNRTLMPGARYKFPPLFTSKNPLIDKYDVNKDLNSEFPTLSKNVKIEIAHRLEHESFNDIINSIINSNTLYVHQKDYHLIPLSHLGEYHTFSINEGIVAFQKIKMNYIQHQELISDLNNIIKTNLKRLKEKLYKLNKEIEDANNSRKYMEYGDAIFTYANDKLNMRLKEIKISEENLIIPLDDKINVSKNAVRFFNKYQKAQKSLTFIKEQIEIANDDLNYFENLQYQIEVGNKDDIEQIRNELIDYGYIKSKKKLNKKPVSKKIKVTEFQKFGAIFYIGKNNLQNEYITFSLANYNDYFFHVKDYPGSHILVKVSTLDENIIRYAANLAAYYSKARYSSTVPVNYTNIKNVKKINGGKIGKVILKNYKTIYIDPNIENI
ncbi:MAG: NFACT family protein [Bacilli bacterium]|nr:NFACT family protein [Bacilli bacterium]